MSTWNAFLTWALLTMGGVIHANGFDAASRKEDSWFICVVFSLVVARDSDQDCLC